MYSTLQTPIYRLGLYPCQMPCPVLAWQWRQCWNLLNKTAKDMISIPHRCWDWWPLPNPSEFYLPIWPDLAWISRSGWAISMNPSWSTNSDLHHTACQSPLAKFSRRQPLNLRAWLDWWTALIAYYLLFSIRRKTSTEIEYGQMPE